MKKQIIAAAALIAAAGYLTVSCRKEGVIDKDGASINFSVSTVYESGPDTKTTYSGKDQDDNSISPSSTSERIDWLDTDKIRILCSQAKLPSGTGNYADYAVTPGSAGGGEHNASIAPVNNDQTLQWNGPGTYYIYALYPSAIQNGDAGISALDGNKAAVTGRIPASQPPKLLDNYAFRPDMDYAYMYADSATTKGHDVSLGFKPLFTALEFTLGSDDISQRLTEVTLSSAQENSYLAGSFSARLTENGLTPLTKNDIQNGSNEITIPLPEQGVKLSQPYTVTFLTLPLEQSLLTITLKFDGGLTRTLDLKGDSQWLTAAACRKTIIRDLNAPDAYTYTLSLSAANDIVIKQDGTPQQYVTVRSYKEGLSSGVKTAEPWTAEFSTDDGRTWSSTPPSWLTASASGSGGSVNGESLRITASTNDSPRTWEGATTDSGPIIDLSRCDIYGNEYPGVGSAEIMAGDPYNTANCYVVSKPGYYIFPLVYGNAIKNGIDNTAAYRKGETDAANTLGAFRNHLGNGITSPWIQDNSGFYMPTGNFTLDDGSKIIDILWQDVPGLIDHTVWYTQNGRAYAGFQITPDKIAQGNAVIALRDREGTTILWSWHIWVMDNPETKLATKAVYSHPTNNVSIVNPQEMLSMNLGFCEGTTPDRIVKIRFSQTNSSETATISIIQNGSTDFGGPFYQWGRKDPLYPNKGGKRKDIYDRNGNSISPLLPQAASVSVGEAIQNPLTFYYNEWQTQTTDWTTPRYDNLWNASFTTNDMDEYVTKTVYDPCPPGFKMPNRNAFSGFSTDGNNYASSSNQALEHITALNKLTMIDDRGCWFPLNGTDASDGKIFFPFTGNIGAAQTPVSHFNLTARGFYLTAAPYNSSFIYLHFSSYTGTGGTYYEIEPVKWLTNRHGAFGVRPVRE